MSGESSFTYADAGVDIDTATRTKRVIARLAQSTYRPEVLSGVGFSGGIFEFKFCCSKWSGCKKST